MTHEAATIDGHINAGGITRSGPRSPRSHASLLVTESVTSGDGPRL